MAQRILIPIDGSECSTRVISQGLDLARAFDAAVTFLYVVEEPVVEVYGVSYGAQLHRDMLKAGDEALDRALARAQASNVPARTQLVEDQHPADAILKAEADHELTVMGTHGRRGLRRMMLGSVAEEVMRRSGRTHVVVSCVADPSTTPDTA